MRTDYSVAPPLNSTGYDKRFVMKRDDLIDMLLVALLAENGAVQNVQIPVNW
jgi:hypothetical protein